MHICISSLRTHKQILQQNHATVAPCLTPQKMLGGGGADIIQLYAITYAWYIKQS